jgi:hypothetical protein
MMVDFHFTLTCYGRIETGSLLLYRSVNFLPRVAHIIVLAIPN